MNLNLTSFWFDNTALCEPPDAAFQAWLSAIGDLRRTRPCGPVDNTVLIWLPSIICDK